MAEAFGAGVLKLSFLGQNEREVINHLYDTKYLALIFAVYSQLTDCSEVIPAAKAVNFGPATFPPTKSIRDIDISVS